MKIVKLGFLALVPAMLAGCVISDGPAYDSGYVRSDTYYVDGNGQRHYRRHRHYRDGGYSGSYGGGQRYSGTYGGARSYPHSGSMPVNTGRGAYSGSVPGSSPAMPANPSRPSGFGHSGSVAPVSRTAPAQAPNRGFTGTNPTPPAHKVIINKPNPSVPQGPSSTHVLKQEVNN